MFEVGLAFYISTPHRTFHPFTYPQVFEVGLACLYFDASAVLQVIASGGPAAEAFGTAFFARLLQVPPPLVASPPGLSLTAPFS